MGDYNAIPHNSAISGHNAPSLRWAEPGRGELYLGDTRLPLTFRRSPQARRLSLKVNPDRRISVVGPRRASVRQVESFVLKHADWVSRQLSKLHLPAALLPGESIPVLGAVMRLERRETHRRDVAEKDILVVAGTERQFQTRLRHLLHRMVREEIRMLADEACERAGLSYQTIALRDTISRWGSCSRKGSLSFSWRLVFAPREVLAYVVYHEVAHLKHMNHGPDFWKLVETLMPDYIHWRAWLMRQGHELHRYQFCPLP